MLALYRAGRRATHSRPINEPDAGSRRSSGSKPDRSCKKSNVESLRTSELAGPPSRPRRTAPQRRGRGNPCLRGRWGRTRRGCRVRTSRAFSGSATPVVLQNSLVVVDPSRNRIVDVVPVGHTPRGVAVGRDYVWVANSADGTISQIGKKSLKIVQTIGLGEQATDLVKAPGACGSPRESTTPWCNRTLTVAGFTRGCISRRWTKRPALRGHRRRGASGGGGGGPEDRLE